MSGFPGTAHFDARGVGSSVYPSGALCVNTLYLSGGLSYWFYDDPASRRGGSTTRRPRGGGKGSGITPCGKVLCSFNCEGTGFANWTSGKPRLVITHKGGSVSSEDGRMEHAWEWMKHGKVAGLKKPLELRLNPSISIKIIDAANIIVRVRGVNTAFEVGNKGLKGGIQDTTVTETAAQRAQKRAARKAARDKRLAEGLGGPEDDADADSVKHPTLLERFENADRNPGAVLDQVHAHHWSLPRLSASGRETWAVADNVRQELRPVVNVAVNMKDRVSSDAMKCSITMRINETLASVGKASPKKKTRRFDETADSGAGDLGTAGGLGGRDFSDPSATLRSKVQSAKSHYHGSCYYKRKKAPPPPPPIVHASRLMRLVRDAAKTELILVCCSKRFMPVCKKVEIIMAEIMEEWRKGITHHCLVPRKSRKGHGNGHGRPSPALATTGGAVVAGGGTGAGAGAGGSAGAGGGDGGGDGAATGAAGTAGGGRRTSATKQGPFDEVFPVPYRLLVADCSDSKVLSKRFRFSVYPLYLAFYGGKLVFASTALVNKELSKDNLLQQLAESMDAARRRRFLPDDFQFTDPRKITLRDLM